MRTISGALELLTRNRIDLTLVDVGASLEPFAPFQPLLGRVTYVAFDPDRRELHEQSDGTGRRVVVDKAVVADPTLEKARFVLTENPTCSSVLQPDMAAINPYLHAHRFNVVDTAEVAATTMDAAMASVGVRRIDWIKLDTQGTDLRLLRSFSAELWTGLMAVDAEPGFDPYYVDEDTFPDLHHELRSRGFWLADMTLTTGVRLRREVFDQHLVTRTEKGRRWAGSKVQRFAYETTLKRSPMAAGPRYLRTVESLASRDALREDYLRLWACAVFSGNLPFALDVLAGCQHIHGTDDGLDAMVQFTAKRNKIFAFGNAWRHAGKLKRRNLVHALRWGARS